MSRYGANPCPNNSGAYNRCANARANHACPNNAGAYNRCANARANHACPDNTSTRNSFPRNLCSVYACA